jgi:hypothetical protein
MRLTQQQSTGIVNALKSSVRAVPVQLYLYGSRVNDNLKGGDIDLLLVTSVVADAVYLNTIKHHLLAAIKKNIGDQKIDLTIVANTELKQDPFLKMILPTAVLLYQLA